jgi:RNA polymerase sigma-70 factor (ECF subfamily)
VQRFDTAVRAHQDRVFNYAFYTLGSREEAEDVTQDVLVRLWQHWPSLDQENVTGWVIRVARNSCLDRLRQRQTRTTLLRQHWESQPEKAVEPEDDCGEENTILRGQIEAALRDLDEPYRSIVILREIDEMSYEQIAASLAMPLNTIKVYLHRARRMLRERLKEARLNARD